MQFSSLNLLVSVHICPFFFFCSIYSSDEDDEDIEMCDHDYDGLLPKSGKRHLGKTRWTREEVTNHVTKMWKKPRMYQFTKNKKSTKLEVLKFISRLSEMLL